MTPNSSYSPSSPIHIDLNIDQNHDQLMFSQNPQTSSSSSSTIFFTPVQDQRGSDQYWHLQQNDHEEGERIIPCGGSLDDHTVTAKNNESNNGLKLKVWRKEDRSTGNYQNENTNDSVKWMSPKMRIMRKMMVSDRETSTDDHMHKYFEDHDQQKKPLETDISTNNSSNTSNNNITIRVCSDCNTTKTPLWRSGPRGPKSLCNACGIRQRKARRAMAAAAAAAAGNGTVVAAETPSMKGKVANKKEKKSRNIKCVPKFKKRCKLGISKPSSKKLCFEDFTVSLSNNMALQKVFPQDEKEAAILLMALSYGLVHG
ncbi:GATA transcription factor [Quillaja saponaria]|uniref:GATA transcription factor n=1 Tax=Quillaja saponaria TaxID=32244 RepID=A0AAD7VKL7_QUISA|nr:GATA transcription factor [Quillaja saponaria]